MPYSITTRDGITIQNIPDNIPSDSQVLRDRVVALRTGQQTPPEVEAPQKTVEPASFGSQLSRQLGLTLRAGVEGALALPALAADAIGSGLSLIPGVDIPSTTETISRSLTDIGVPKPETTQERIVGGAARALAGGGTGIGAGQAISQAIPAVSKALTAAPGLQAASAITGGGAAELAASQGAGPIGQTVAGLAGGIIPSVPGIAGQVGRIIRPQATDKLVQAGESVGKKFIDQLSELSGKEVLADTSPAFKGLAQGVVGRTPATRELAETALSSRTKNLSKRLSLKVREVFKRDGDIFEDTAALLADRAKTAQPLYAEAFSQPIARTIKGNEEVAKRLTKLLETDAVKKAIPRARRIASNEGRNLPENLANANVQTWDDIKQGLDDVIQANTTEFGKLNKVGASVVKVKNQLLGILDANKSYKLARDTFAGDSEMLNSLKFGGDVLTAKISPSEVRARFKTMNPAEKDAALSGLAGSIKNQIGRVKEDTASATNFISSPNNKEKIAALIGNEGFNKLKQFVDTEVMFRKTMAELVGGSQTQLRNAAEKAVNSQINITDPTKTGIANMIAKGFGKLRGLTDSEALKLTQLTSTPKGRFQAIEILKRKGLNGAEIRSVLPALLQIQATQN